MPRTAREKSESIYGDLKDICRELKEFLDQYTVYAEEFNFFEQIHDL